MLWPVMADDVEPTPSTEVGGAEQPAPTPATRRRPSDATAETRMPSAEQRTCQGARFRSAALGSRRTKHILARTWRERTKVLPYPERGISETPRRISETPRRLPRSLASANDMSRCPPRWGSAPEYPTLD